MAESQITLVVLENGQEVERIEVQPDDYYLLTTGSCYVAGTQVYPKAGTHVITVKGQRAQRLARA